MLDHAPTEKVKSFLPETELKVVLCRWTAKPTHNFSFSASRYFLRTRKLFLKLFVTSSAFQYYLSFFAKGSWKCLLLKLFLSYWHFPLSTFILWRHFNNNNSPYTAQIFLHNPNNTISKVKWEKLCWSLITLITCNSSDHISLVNT